MIGAAAMALVLCCALLAVGRTRVRIDTEVDPLRVTVGEPATGSDLGHQRVQARDAAAAGRAARGRSRPRASPCRRSGRARRTRSCSSCRPSAAASSPVGPASTVQGDPLGIVRRTLRWTDVTELFVHPRTISLESLGAGLLRDLEGETTQEMSMSDLAFHALREYQPGDDRRYIHWRSSAKAGRLLVRQFLDTRRSHLTDRRRRRPRRSTPGARRTPRPRSRWPPRWASGPTWTSRTSPSCAATRPPRAPAPRWPWTRWPGSSSGPATSTRWPAKGSRLAPDTSMAVLVTGSAHSLHPGAARARPVRVGGAAGRPHHRPRPAGRGQERRRHHPDEHPRARRPARGAGGSDGRRERQPPRPATRVDAAHRAHPRRPGRQPALAPPAVPRRPRRPRLHRRCWSGWRSGGSAPSSSAGSGSSPPSVACCSGCWSPTW